MKMYFTKALGVCCTFAMFLLMASTASAQCLDAANGQWPSGATGYTPVCDGSAKNITTAAWTDEYSRVNLVAGETYTFSTSDASLFITISDADGTAAYVFGTGSVEYTPAADEQVRFYAHLDSDCDGITGSQPTHTRSVQCGEVDCPVLNANVGDTCDDGDETTFDDVVTEDCECIGTPYDCPLELANIGDACDDGDANTLNDLITEDCTCEGTAASSGQNCGAPIAVTALPYTATDNTANYGDTYSSADVPSGVTYPGISNGSTSASYLNGDDVVYEYTADFDGTLEIGLDGTAGWVGLWVFKGCPFSETLAYDKQSAAGTRNIQGLPVTTGETIYVVISTFPTPQSTAYTLTIEELLFDCPALEADFGDTCDDGEETTFDDVVTEDCECIGTPYDCPVALANIGDACDDGNPLTEGTTIDSDCGCTGGTTIVFEGCTNTGFNFGDANPECNSTDEITGAYTYEDADVTVVSGDDYIFSVSEASYYVTVADENDNILAFGQETASWTATFDGIVKFYSHAGPDCPTTSGFATSHSKFVERVCDTSEFDCPEELANIGDPCDDGDPLTEGSTLDSECECTGGTAIVFEGCTNGGAFGSRTPECSGDAAVQTGAYTAEYVVVNVEEGIDYTFTISNPDYFATVSTDEDPAAVLAFGQETASWTSTFDGSVRFYSHAGPGCPEISGGATSHTRTIQAGACIFDCPEEEANIGDPCEIAGFFDATIDENCECVGTPFDCPEAEANIGDACEIAGEGAPFSASLSVQAVGNPTTFEANDTYTFDVPAGFEGNYDLTASAAGETFNGSWRSEFRVRVTAPDGSVVTNDASPTFSDEWQPTSQTQGGEFTGEVTLEGLSGIEGTWTVEVRMSFNEGETVNALVDLDFDFVSSSADGVLDENCECIIPCLSEGGELSIDGSNRVCVGTGAEATFDNAVLTGAAGDNSIWVLTLGNTNVLATSATGPDFDLDGLTPGSNYRIRHISYADDVDINAVLSAPSTGGCWDLSNSIGITLTAEPEAPSISTNSLTTVCSGEGTPKFVIGTATGGSGAAGSAWVLTDDADNVLAFRFANSNFNLDPRPAGMYKLYNVNWADGFTPSSSTSNINDLGACTGTSNAIEITVLDCSPGAFITSDPNPTAGASWVTFSVDEPQQVQVEVYDMAGRHIKTVFNQNAAGSQDYRMQFDGTSLPNGVYLYRMTTENEVITDKFMIAR